MNNAAGIDEHWCPIEKQSQFLYIFARIKDNNNKNDIQDKIKHIGVYTDADTYQEMHLHLKMGNKNQYMPITTQTERNKTDISSRNTLSQLHWLHHSLNTQYRQDLIANIWWVWIYKNQTKVPPAPTPSYLSLCTLWWGFVSDFSQFLSVHSLTLWRMSEGSKATFSTNLLHPYPLCHSCWHYTELLRSASYTYQH